MLPEPFQRVESLWLDVVTSTQEVIVMVKSARRKTAATIATAADRPSNAIPNRSATMTGRDIARRAYELYERRGREHGHDLDDWLQAERELQEALSSTAA